MKAFVVGATGVLRSLLDRGAIGLITTHDLALTAVASDLPPHRAGAVGTPVSGSSSDQVDPWTSLRGWRG